MNFKVTVIRFPVSSYGALKLLVKGTYLLLFG